MPSVDAILDIHRSPSLYNTSTANVHTRDHPIAQRIMPRFTILISITFLLLALTARSQLILQTPEQLAQIQETLNADPSFPHFDMTGPSDGGPTTGGPKLTECLTVERKLSLFYEYLREVTPVVSPLTS